MRCRATRRAASISTRDKMHVLDHVGRHFKVRGPLDVPRPPQGHIPIFTAGGSEQAQELAARIADGLYAGQPDHRTGARVLCLGQGTAGEIRTFA